MLIKENPLKNNINQYIPSHFKDLFNKNFIVLDIETTGFSRKNASIILIGMIIKTNNNIIYKQLFCENLKEEKNILLELKKILDSNRYDLLITYNGYSFDIPFINSKFKQHNINYKINNLINFDIYRLIRSNKNKLNLKRYNLKTIEKFLNIDRSDTISGKDSIKLYFKYLKTKDNELLNKILLHNYEDILYLLPILKILKYFEYNEVMPFYPKLVHNNIFLKDYVIKNNHLILNLYSKNKFKINYYDEYFSIASNGNIIKCKFTIKKLLINNIKYYLFNHRIIFNKTWDELDNNSKNNLIFNVNDEFQFIKLINFIRKILTKKI